MASSPKPIPFGPAAGTWIQHLSPDGRPFWNHSVTKQSVWEKPSELKTPMELEMEQTNWKEYETNGRKYWVHSETKVTTWEMPKEIQDILAKAATASLFPAQGGFGSPAPAFSPGPPHPGFSPGQTIPGASTPLNAISGALVAPGGFNPGLPARPSVGLPDLNASFAVMPEYQTTEEAEQGFIGMLQRKGVDMTWTWEKTMRETITDPFYKALKTLAERKAAFEKYVADLKKAEVDAKEKSLEKHRKDWTKALDRMGGGPEKEEGVKAWWSWERARGELQRRIPEAWKGPRNDEERRALFEEYVRALKVKQSVKKDELRKRNIAKLTDMIKDLNLDLGGTVKWREAQETVLRLPEWQTDSDLQRIEPIDFLGIFEEQVKIAEKAASDIRVKTNIERKRRGRKAREGFVSLLAELREAGHITAGTTWQSVYPLVESDERFENLLGVPGSSPLDLFWDMVDELELQAEDEGREVESIFESKGGKVEESSTFEEFSAALEGEEKVKDVDLAVLRAIFDKLHGRAVRIAKEDKRKAEKKLRLLVDDLRYAYKKLDPPIELESSYEDNLARIQETPEFLALSHDETSQRTAFEKFIKRQKEKMKERESIEADERRHSNSRSHRHSESHRSTRRDRSRERSVGDDKDDGEQRSKRQASEDTVEGMALPRHKASKLSQRKSDRKSEAGDEDVEMKDGGDQSEVEEGEI